jgi:sec-independent protein translocase protein TatA
VKANIISIFALQLQHMTAAFILGILGGLGATEIIVILVIVLLFFGGKKIPELMKGLGRGVKDFKDASKGESNDNEPAKK